MSTAGRGRVVDPVNREVANVVNEKLAAAGITREKLGELTGIPRSTVSKLVAGTSPMDLRQLALIAEALGTSAWQILREAERTLATPAPSNVHQLPTRERGVSEGGVPDFSRLAARAVSCRPEWDAVKSDGDDEVC